MYISYHSTLKSYTSMQIVCTISIKTRKCKNNFIPSYLHSMDRYRPAIDRQFGPVQTALKKPVGPVRSRSGPRSSPDRCTSAIECSQKEYLAQDEPAYNSPLVECTVKCVRFLLNSNWERLRSSLSSGCLRVSQCRGVRIGRKCSSRQ